VRRYALLALVLAAFVIGPQPALACSCVQSTKPQQATDAAMVFTGTVQSASGSFLPVLTCSRSSADTVDYTLSVDTVYKGDVSRTVVVRTVVSGASCGYQFAVGKRYTVFATTTDGRMETNLCRGNFEGDIAPAEYGLAAGHAPRG